MKQKPKGILFKGEMIRALLNTQIDVWPAKPVDESLPWKYQTRRVVDPQPPIGAVVSSEGLVEKWPKCEREFGNFGRCERIEPKYPPGSILYARETWAVHPAFDNLKPTELDDDVLVTFKTQDSFDFERGGAIGRWRVGRFMMMKFARLWFRVINVRVERVNAISGDDARAEGTHGHDNQVDANAIGRYRELCDSINGQGDFDKGKYVWVYEIQRITKPV